MARVLSTSILATLLFVWSYPARAAAPATQPGRAEWTAAVVGLGRAVAANDVESLASLVAGEVTLQRFDGTPAGANKLFALPGKRTLLFAKAYPRAPDALASDISEAARGWKIADEVKAQFVITDPAREKTSDQWASRWVLHTLSSQGFEPVGVIMLWCEDPDNGNPGQVYFILLRGQLGTGSELRIASVVFGQPLAEAE